MNSSLPLPTVSVIVPALNEAANIAAAVHEIIQAVDGRCADYELVLIDDGSSDHTGRLMEELACTTPRLRVIHNLRPRNLGGVFKQGVAVARYECVMMVPGDNENPRAALAPLLEAIGSADVVVPYTVNRGARPWIRRALSRVYTMILNRLSGRRLRYYNGTVIFRTADVRRVTIRTDSFAYVGEALVKVLAMGKGYVEIGIRIHPTTGRRSKALSWRNLVGVARALVRLWWDVRSAPPLSPTPAGAFVASLRGPGLAPEAVPRRSGVRVEQP